MKRVVLFGVAALAFCLAAEAAKDVEESVRVLRVIDGDSLAVKRSDGTECLLRLDLVDAPEEGQEYWRVAKGRLTALVGGQDVLLGHPRTDEAGVLRGIVWIGDIEVNLLLLQEGWAWPDKSCEASVFHSSAAQQAATEKRGLWRGKAEKPWEWRAAHDKQVVTLDDMKRIHGLATYKSYAAAQEAISAMLPVKECNVQWNRHAAPRKGKKKGLFTKPIGDFCIENVFTYDNGGDHGGVARRVGLAVSVRVRLSYLEGENPPTDQQCMGRVSDLATSGGEILDESFRQNRILPLRESAKRRFGASSVKNCLYDAREGKVVVFLENCVAEKVNNAYCPSTPSSSTPKPSKNESYLRQQRINASWIDI